MWGGGNGYKPKGFFELLSVPFFYDEDKDPSFLYI